MQCCGELRRLLLLSFSHLVVSVQADKKKNLKLGHYGRKRLFLFFFYAIEVNSICNIITYATSLTELINKSA